MYGEPPKCFTAKNPRAKKQHKCCECRGVIEVGEKYHVFSGVWDFVATYNTCENCEVLREEIIKEIKDPEDYPAFGSLYELIFEGHEKWISLYMYIRRKRHAPESPKGWMEKREIEYQSSL